jgi:Tol biopolymer transport system component/DNA-binding winged helix-turn-helix (wHTH) protein
MWSPPNGLQRLRFGPFQADVSSGELYKLGRRVQLQDQPFRILVMLLERPGEVVTREEVRKELWPYGTFIDFDEGLDTALKKLRHALGDSAQNPNFIETIPRRGYRLIAAVETERTSTNEAGSDATGGGHQSTHQYPRDLQTGMGREAELDRAVRIQAVLPRDGLNLQLAEPAQPERSLSVVEPASGASEFLKWAGWGVSAVLLVAAVIFGLGYSRRTSGPERALHFSLPLSPTIRDVALSHGGRTLAFIAPRSKEGGITLWVHEVGASDARPLENTQGASYPFWSPDDKFIAFFADGKLKKIAAAGGPVQVLCDAPIGRGGTWNRDGVVVFARDSGVALYRVSAAGGAVTLVNGFEQKVATTLSSRWPVFLPDGKHFLYTSVDFGADLRGDGNAIFLAALDAREHRRLVTSNSNAAYIPPGFLLFLRNGTLMAQRFDADRLQLRGEAFAVANGVEYLSSVARALFSVSENGTLVYQTGSGATFSQLEWFDREGKQLGTVGTPARYANPRLAPDGKRVAVDIDDPQSSNTDIWLLESTHHVPYRLTFDPSQDEAPLWSHNGKSILWLSDRGGKNGFYMKASDGSGSEKSLMAFVRTDLSFASAPSDWSSDGRYFLYTDLQEGDSLHLWVLPMSGDRRPYRFLPGTSADVEGQFSPDGHWVAYSSNESGKWQIYVAPFPGPGGKYQISAGGGQQPRWRRDGKELFFLSPHRTLMAARVKTGSTFGFSAPIALFETRAHEPLTAEEFFTYDVSFDGQRFLINANAEQKDIRPVDILLNWSLQLK